ncbi:MAG: hypothetical protein HZB91_03765 [Elusimicrobia bacterium]|nr:hypothetical protein [Elusimicrobiota bacterium]
MAARGETIPEVDRDAQYPEGIRTSRELTMLMENLTGWTWRFWPFRIPFDFRMFVILWVAVVSSLSIPALYVAALRLTSDASLAMAAAWVYGLSWAATGDFIGSYTFQCLALPLIFWSFACFCVSLEPEGGARRGWALASGILMALALASWHVTRFYLAAFFAAAAWAARPVAGGPRPALRESLAVLVACCMAAGLALPVLRETRFAASPAMIFGCALLAALWQGPRAAGAVALAGAVLFLGLGQGSVEDSAYGHTYRLFWDKLKFLLVKPADPASLDPDGRLLWVGPFNSPGAGFLVFNFVPLVFIALPRLALGIQGLFRRGDGTPAAGGARTSGPAGWALADGMLVLTAVGTAAMTRIAPFAAFFLPLAAVRLRFAAGSRLRLAVLLGLAALAAVEGLVSSKPYSRLNPFMYLTALLMPVEDRPMVSLADERAVLKWLKERAAGRPVLAHFGLSGPILAYCGTPVLLNPKGESASSRSKSRAFLAALYGSEDGFRRFCAGRGAAFFVYGTGYILDESQDGARYSSGGMRLSADSAAVKFHFYPERLKGFRLVYQNPDFRIFSVDSSTGTSGASSPRPLSGGLPGDPVYDIDRFSPVASPDGTLSLDVGGVIRRMSARRAELFKARLMARMGQREAAFEAYGRAFAAWPAPGTAQDELERLSGRPVPIDAAGVRR